MLIQLVHGPFIKKYHNQYFELKIDDSAEDESYFLHQTSAKSSFEDTSLKDICKIHHI